MAGSASLQVDLSVRGNTWVVKMGQPKEILPLVGTDHWSGDGQDPRT